MRVDIVYTVYTVWCAHNLHFVITHIFCTYFIYTRKQMYDSHNTCVCAFNNNNDYTPSSTSSIVYDTHLRGTFDLAKIESAARTTAAISNAPPQTTSTRTQTQTSHDSDLRTHSSTTPKCTNLSAAYFTHIYAIMCACVRACATRRDWVA